MTNKYEIYRCSICGNVIEILISGDGHPVCCGKEMERMESQNDNHNSPNLTEKHSPIINHDNNVTKISVTKHPMEKEHYIMFIQAISKDKSETKIKFFHPEQDAIMTTDITPHEMDAKSYCNIHGIYTNNKHAEDTHE